MKSNLDFEISFFEGLVEKNPSYVDALSLLAEAYTRKGWYEKGLELDERLSRMCPQDPTVHYNLACSYALKGDSEKAFSALRQAIKTGYDDLEHFLQDSDLKTLRKDPRFQELAAAIPLEEE